MSLSQESLDITVGGSPSIVVSSMTFLGFPLSEWIYVVTIFYTIVATFALIRRIWLSYKKEEKVEEKKEQQQENVSKQQPRDNSSEHS